MFALTTLPVVRTILFGSVCNTDRSIKRTAQRQPVAVFAFSAQPVHGNRDTRNPSSRRADTRPRNPVKCVKRLRGLANATQPNELVRGSVTAGQVSASPLPIFFPTQEGRGVGGMDGLPFPDLPPEPTTTLLINI